MADIHPHFARNWAIVPGIEPVDGWVMVTRDVQDGEGFWTPEYIAVRGEWERDLGVSRFRFTPSQDRFAWLICNPNLRCNGKAGVLGSWDDTSIEAMMVAREMAA